ncbi:MAG: hypothetical protein AAF677_10265 [Pseudomonadota bacterium]
MLTKVLMTVLLIAAVFFIGRLSTVRRPRMPRRWRGRVSPDRRGRAMPEPVEDLIECPACGRFHASSEYCPCDQRTP